MTPHLRRGLAAGAIGGTAMSVATNLEMRIRGREPSRVPVQTIERFLPLDLSRRQEERLATVGHVISSAGFGLLRGLLEATSASAAFANAAFAAAAFSPDFVVIPATGGAPPPWRWRLVELVTSAVHHGRLRVDDGLGVRVASAPRRLVVCVVHRRGRERIRCAGG